MKLIQISNSTQSYFLNHLIYIIYTSEITKTSDFKYDIKEKLALFLLILSFLIKLY